MRSGAPAARAGAFGLAIAPLHLALILTVVLVWAFNFIATKVALAEIPPFLLTSMRFALVAAVLLPFVERPRSMAPIVAVSLCLGVAHFALMFWALASTTKIAPIAVTVQLNLPFGALLAALLLGDHLGPRRLIGMAIALCGVTLMTFDPVVFAELDALGLAVAAAFFWALASVLTKRFEVATVFTLNAYIGLLAAPQLLILSLLFEEGHVATLGATGLPAWGGVLYNALAVSVFGYGVWFTLLRHYSVNLVTPFTLLVPPLAAVLSVFWFGEVLTLEILLGGLLTLTGVGVILVRRPDLAPRS